jgi:hypothetical protein
MVWFSYLLWIGNAAERVGSKTTNQSAHSTLTRSLTAFGVLVVAWLPSAKVDPFYLNSGMVNLAAI